MEFKISHTDAASRARVGEIKTAHGTISTPIFMPVGTAAAVKAVHMQELDSVIGADIILGNTYHLLLRPGIEVIKEAGGLHQFNGWNKSLLTDSGGYQVYSLGAQRKIKEEGVTFRSHIDGSKRFLSPEIAIDIQKQIGADIIMAFDECTPYPCPHDYAKKSMQMTHRWLDRCTEAFKNKAGYHNYPQTLAAIVQGSVYKDLRKESAEYIASANTAINAIGGLSVGEPHEDMYESTELVCSILPKEKPRYLMGVGTPSNLLECIALGVDMFDCVLPSRNARHGLLYTWDGMINIKNEKWKQDYTPIDAKSKSPTSRNHHKAYLRHLIISKEKLGAQIATLHNLSFFLELMRISAEKIKEGTFSSWKNAAIPSIEQRL